MLHTYFNWKILEYYYPIWKMGGGSNTNPLYFKPYHSRSLQIIPSLISVYHNEKRQELILFAWSKIIGTPFMLHKKCAHTCYKKHVHMLFQNQKFSKIIKCVFTCIPFLNSVLSVLFVKIFFNNKQNSFQICYTNFLKIQLYDEMPAMLILKGIKIW